MKKVNASHAEFVGCADRLRVMSGDVSGDAWAAMLNGAGKLEQAAALLDVFADTIRALQAERDELKSELGAVRPRTEGRMDELISRDALKDALAKRVPFAVVTSDDAAFAYGLDAAYVAVQEAPTIDPVRHGHWKATFAGRAICSACDEDQEVETFVGNAVQKYCARCGARMDAEEENDG